MQAGAVLAVRLRASRPGGAVVRPDGGREAAVSFYCPGKDPEHVQDDRVPDREVPLAFDEPSRVYGADVPTAGWEAGMWTYQGAVMDASGVPYGWAWGTFILDP